MEKKNTGLIVFIVILSLLVLGLGGIVIYDRVSNNKNDNITEKDDNNQNKNNNNNSSTNDDTVYKYSLANRKEVQLISDIEYFNIWVDVEGNAYVSLKSDANFNGNAGAEHQKKMVAKFKKMTQNYSFKVYGNNSKSDEKVTINAYKLTDKVLTAYSVDIGDVDNYEMVAFIKENGTVSFFMPNHIYFGGEIFYKELDGLKNVVSIVRNYSEPYAITSDGTEILLEKYITEY